MVEIVTGAAGFIGSHLTEELLRQGRTVVGIDNFHPYYDEKIKRQNLKEVRNTASETSGELKFVEGSVLSKGDLEELPEEPENVYHMAAIAGVRNSIQNPAEYSNINVRGTAELIEYFEDIGKFILASSSSVYGEVSEEELPVSEERSPEPIAPYPLSKVQAEQIVRMYSDLYGFQHAVLRFFTVYGPRQRPDEAFTKFIKMILDEEPVTVYGDGEQTRDFTFVKDIVEGCIKAAGKGNGTYNLGSNRRVSVNRMVEALDEIMDEKVKKKHVEQPEGDASHTHADISRAKEELGYEPGTSFNEGTKDCVKWCKDRRRSRLL